MRSAMPPSSVRGPAAEPSREDALQERLTSALAYVSKIRSLSANAEVRGRVIGRAQIEQYIRAQLDEETPPDVLAATEALLYGFGVVNADFDYRTCVLGLMSSQLLGFYDPKRKTFFVGGDLEGEEAEVTLWHELVHALQDQHYDLSTLSAWRPDEGDRQSAVHGLAEGDATSTMLDAMLKPRGITALDVPESLMRAQTVLGTAIVTAPPVIVRSLLAPYADGLAFANYLRRSGGFAAVDKAWRAPPSSTEQLLHPEKFLAGEAPLRVALPLAPRHAPELQKRFHDVMGEQTLKVLLEEWLPARTAASAAADWGGDRVAVFADEARSRWAIAWHLRFDSTTAAKRAFVALERTGPLAEPAGRKPLASDPGRAHAPRGKVCRAGHTRGAVALVLRGADVAVTVGPFGRGPESAAGEADCHAALAWASELLTN